MTAKNWRQFDESDVRIRAGKGSRPRTKRRPSHENAISALVTTVDRGRWTCAIDADPQQVVTAMRARELGRSPIVVGDRVGLVGDTSGQLDSLARIVRIEERTTILRRTADDNDPTERIVVANAEQLLIVVALADPPPRLGFIDRCLVASYSGGLRPLLCLTKADLADPNELLAHYADLAIEAVVIEHGQVTAELIELLQGHTTALVGHSGVGKSTLVNQLVPTAALTIGKVSAIGKGKHTSVASLALPLPVSGWVIDTPGVRSFGLAHVTEHDIVLAFPEFAAAAEECPSGCRHLGPPQDPQCQLDVIASPGSPQAARLISLRRLLESRARLESF